MSTQKEYIEEAKEILGLTSTYALSIEWDIHRAYLSDYIKDKRRFDEYICFKLGEVLNKEPDSIIADVLSQIEKNDTKREFWIEQRKKYQQGWVAYDLEMILLKLSILGIGSQIYSHRLWEYIWPASKGAKIIESSSVETLNSIMQTSTISCNPYYVK